MAYSEILFEKQNAIATVTINRPHAMNSGTIRTWGEIADAFHDAERDNDIRVVVLTGAGRAFCAGDDVKEIFLNPEFRDAKPNAAQARSRSGARMRRSRWIFSSSIPSPPSRRSTAPQSATDATSR